MSSVWESLVSNSKELATSTATGALTDLTKNYLGSSAPPNQPLAQTPSPAPTTNNVGGGGLNKWLIIGGVVALAVVGFFFFKKK